MRQVLLSILSMILAVGLVGCDSSDSSNPTAEVRFMHASPGAGSVTVLVEGEEVVSGVAYNASQTAPAVTDYADVVLANEVSVEVQDSDGNTLLTADDIAAELEGGEKHTIVIAGTQGASSSAPEAIVLRDRFKELGDNEIGLRIVHGSAGAGPVDVYLTPPGTSLGNVDPIVSDFAFGDDFPGGFAGQFNAQTLSDNGSVLSVTQPGSTTPVLQLEVGTGSGTSLEVPAGQYVTGVAVDAPGSTPPVGALIQLDTN